MDAVHDAKRLEDDANCIFDLTMCEKKRLSASDKLAIALAEFFGTAILVFLCCMGCNKAIGDISPLHAALGTGFAVATVIHLFGHISAAHVNPMSTLCAVILGEISLSMVPVYVASELAGSIVGYGLLKLVTPDWQMQGNNEGFCTTVPSSDLSDVQALGVEVCITIILAFANCSAWDSRNSTRSDSVAVRFGLLVSAICMAANPYTGASMNPARSFGPAVWNNYWHRHWIYWVGPLSAGAAVSTFYRLALKKKKDKTYRSEDTN